MKINWTKWVGKRAASSILIATYSFFAMMALFVAHGSWAYGGRLVLQEFSEKYPEEISSFSWLSNCRINLTSSIIIGLFSGLLLSFVAYILVNSGIRRSSLVNQLTRIWTRILNLQKLDQDYSHITVGVSYMIMFLIVFIFTALLFDPHLRISIVDLAYLSAFAATGAVSAVQRVSHSRKLPMFHDPQLEMKYLELEHAGAREKLHQITWGVSTSLIVIIISNAIIGYYSAPREIFNSEGYSICWLGSLLQMFILIIGLGLGLIYQFWNYLDSITHRIKEIDRMHANEMKATQKPS